MELTRRSLLAVPFAASAFQSPGQGFAPLTDWTIVDGPESAFTFEEREIRVHAHASLPCWLRSAREYENFEFHGEFFTKGWTDSGIYIHAPEHGRPTEAGIQIKVFHQKEDRPVTNSVGSIFPVIAPKLTNVREGWNDIRVLSDWPRLQVWINGELIHDHNVQTHPDLRHRLRSGYIGIAGGSTECRYRNFRVRELPGKESWITLYEKPADFANWRVSEAQPNVQVLGPVLRMDGQGHIAFKDQFRNFYLQMYIRGVTQHNGGVLFRTAGRGLSDTRFYEIQLHPVEESHFPTGSLYFHKRSRYPRLEDEKWFLFELYVDERDCLVRINGETVTEYSGLENNQEGFIELQAHRRGYWIEFKRIRLQRL